MRTGEDFAYPTFIYEVPLSGLRLVQDRPAA